MGRIENSKLFYRYSLLPAFDSIHSTPPQSQFQLGYLPDSERKGEYYYLEEQIQITFAFIYDNVIYTSERYFK